MNNNTVTVPEAARIMGVNPHTVRKLIKDGKIEAYRLQKKYRVNLLSIPAFMRKETK